MQKRKITSILICVLMLFGLMTPAALADEIVTQDFTVAWQEDWPSAVAVVQFTIECPPGYEFVSFEPGVPNVTSSPDTEKNGKMHIGFYGESGENTITPTDGSLSIGTITYRYTGTGTAKEDAVVFSDTVIGRLNADNDGTSNYVQKTPQKGELTVDADGKVTAKPVVISDFNVPLASASSAFMKGDPEGTIRPNGTLTRAELAQMFYNLYGNNRTDFTASFSDVEMGLWYSIPIAFCQANGYMKGDAGATTFRPNDTLTRAELATAFVNMKGLPLTPSHPFTDVAGDHWGREYIGAAYAAGLMKGDEGTTNFRPNDKNTRAEAVVVICNAEGRDYTKFDTAKTFSDLTPGVWYYPYMMHAANGYSN